MIFDSLEEGKNCFQNELIYFPNKTFHKIIKKIPPNFFLKTSMVGHACTFLKHNGFMWPCLHIYLFIFGNLDKAYNR